MASAVLVSIAGSLASGILTEVAKKAGGALSESSTVTGLKSAFFGGLETDLRLLEKELRRLNSVLSRAQSIDSMHYDKNDLLLIWLGDVKDAACYADNLLDEIAYEKIRRKLQIQTNPVVRLFARSDTSSFFRIRIAGKFEKFASLTAEIHKDAETTLRLTELAGNALTATNQPPPPTMDDNLRGIRENPDTLIVMGREADEELIVNSLCSPQDGIALPVLAIVGISGVGKSTLAKMVYENEIVKEHFGKRTWIFVSDNFRLDKFLDEMLQTITGKSHGLTNINAMEEIVKQCLQEEKKGYLLVLDDVWNTDEQLWKSVESLLVRVTCSTRCKVLVTTQSSHVARLMCASPTHELKDLSDHDAWALFKRLAFVNRTREQLSDFEDVGRKILRKCKGLPLAIKTMGSLLGSMNEKSEWDLVERSEIWDLSLDQSNIMPWLHISFHHLRDAAIKQCFVHCSFVIEKGQIVQQSELVQAWMAQGFIHSTSESDKRIEDIGDTYVSKLVANGLLQVFMMSNRCLKMHDLVHDLARYISRETIWTPRKARDLEPATEAEHVRICGEGKSESVYNLPKDKKLRKLRTLICTRATLSVDFAAQTKFLRDLRLIDCGLEKVPSSIGMLKHLRYLSLRDNPFWELPESIGKLFNLQILDLTECNELKELPQGITKLPNLLTCLRTLPRILIVVDEGFEIKELKNLELLGEDVEISGLHLLSCKKDGVKAKSLKTKARVKKLTLNWGPIEQGVDKASNDEGVMDGLHPHSNLEEITVDGFGGRRLSSWLLDMNNLVTIKLSHCKHCVQLPALGQLASLDRLHIEGMESLQVIGVEFYHSDDEGRSSRPHRDLFPSLRRLCLQDMQKFRDWVQPSKYYIDKLFPCLETLEIRDCPLLVSAPTYFPDLRKLSVANIRSVKTVKMILTNTIHLSKLDISGVKDLYSLSFLQVECQTKGLVELYPPTLQSVTNTEGLLQSLGELEIEDCPNLHTTHGLESCVSLQRLSLRGISKLELIPDLRKLSGQIELVDVSQRCCQMELSGLIFNQLYDEPDAYISRGLFNFEWKGQPKLYSLPSERLNGQYLMLTFSGFGGIDTLPEWLRHLSFLHELVIRDCKNLMYLPSQDAMKSLTKLESIQIRHCPILEKRCRKNIGEEWHKISHIYSIRIGEMLFIKGTQQVL